MIANEGELERKPRLFGVAERGRVGRIRNGEDKVGVRRRLLARQLATELTTRAIDGAPPDAAVGAREVDVLEDALARLLALQRERRSYTTPIDGDDLPALQVALEGGTD